jgi:hypothetical protein
MTTALVTSATRVMALLMARIAEIALTPSYGLKTRKWCGKS